MTIAVPASFFAIILGLTGLGNGWRLAARLGYGPSWIGEAIMLAATAIWAALILLYAGKWLWARAEALAEFRHPVLCCFIALVPVSTALISLAVRPYTPEIAGVLAFVGIIGQLGFGLYRTGRLWMGGRDPATTTPVLYLPTVGGSFVSVIVLSAFGHPDWALPFFGAGLLSWLAIESVLMHRLYTLPELAPPLRPTLGIQLAPPVIGCAAYLSITNGPPDLFAQGLLGYGILQALLLIRLQPWIAQVGFTAGYWAFTFGATALAFDMFRFAERSGGGLFADIAPVVFGVANLIVAGIALGTLWLLARGRLLPSRLAAPS